MPQVLEEWIALFAAQLPQPVDQQQAPDGSMYFVGGDPGEVIVRLTHSTIAVFEYAATREGRPHTPVVRPVRIGSVAWSKITDVNAIDLVLALVGAARDSRRRKFRTCTYCERSTPPEHMHSDDVCMSCAEQHPDVID